ncbi:MAG: hypothetical protein ACRD0Y_10720 [Terriglobales bacterium]
MADYNFLLTTRLNQDQQLALQILQEACQQRRLNLYFTGGSMRDLLTGHTVRLLNFTTEGDPLPLEPALAAAGGERLSPRAETATLSLSLRGCRMRIQAARSSATTTTPGTIHEDLRRRGLALNSIGLSLNSASRGLPLDPCNGAADIETHLIRMNHPYVFFEDPIAALRAVRLRSRLGFNLDERTAARMAAAREENYVARATPASRGQEWEAIAYESDPGAVLVALEKEQWLSAAFGSSVKTSKMDLGGLGRLTAGVEVWEQLGLQIDVGLVAMPMLLAGLAPADQTRLGPWLPSRHLAAGWKKLTSDAEILEKRLLALSPGAAWMRSVQDLIEKVSPETVAYASISPANPKTGKKLKEFQTQAILQRQKLPLGVLRILGVAPRSLQAEAILRPWYKRLLGGEDLSEAMLAEGIRAAVAALRPVEPVAAVPKPPAPAKARKAVPQPTPKPPARSTAQPQRSAAKPAGRKPAARRKK